MFGEDAKEMVRNACTIAGIPVMASIDKDAEEITTEPETFMDDTLCNGIDLDDIAAIPVEPTEQEVVSDVTSPVLDSGDL